MVQVIPSVDVEFAYFRMFEAAKRFSNLFFHKDLTVRFISIDRAHLDANTTKSSWPDVQVLNCYAHLAPKLLDNVKKLKTPEFYDNVIKMVIDSLRL